MMRRGQPLALLLGAVLTAAQNCSVRPREIPYFDRFEGRGLAGFVPIRLDTAAVRAATSAWLEPMQLDTEKQCSADKKGSRMWRAAAVNAFIVGYSRTGTTSLRSELIRSCKATREGRSCAIVSGLNGEGECSFFNNPGRQWKSQYWRYLERARGRLVNCDDATRACVTRKSSKLLVDKTPEYASAIRYLMGIYYTNPEAKIVLSLRYPWNYFERHLRENPNAPPGFVASQWHLYTHQLRAARCPTRPTEGNWTNACSLVASPFAKLGTRTFGRWSDSTMSYFGSGHFVYLVDVLHRMFGPANVLVLRMDWCVVRDVCGARLAAFLGLPHLKIRGNPYAPLANSHSSAVHPADDRDPMDIMAGLGFERDMAEDLRFHERLLFRYLGWDWPRAWSAPPDA